MKRLTRFLPASHSCLTSSSRRRGSESIVLALAATLAFGLSACGDDITEQVTVNANVGAVETSKDLPECTKEIAGQTAFISETHEFLGCDGKEWLPLSASTVSVGDNVCMSKSLSDDTGFEIFCNGESIGTVKNGKDGAPGTNGTDGTNGKDGTSCSITGSTATSVTIACGTESFTMDLTGYADQPEECDASVNAEDCATLDSAISLSGVSQKGPFVTGTDITAYELQNGRSLKQTGKTFGGKIERADGTFDIKTVKLNSAFAYIVADGFYRNEVTGENSSAAIKLRALTNLKGRSSANINLVTHLEYDRVQYLVTRKDSSVTKAKMAAEKELFAAFGIDNSGFEGLAEDLNVLKEGKGNAALLAISVLLQGDRNESELTALLASLSVDLGDNGQWDNAKQRAQIADWAMKTDLNGGLSKIRANVEGWKLAESAAPAFEQHVTNFWMQELGVDKCDSSNAGALFAVKNKNSANYAANDSAYTEGDSSLVRLICAASGDSYAWRFATDTEKDVAAFTAADDGAVKRGSVDTTNVYVKEKGNWRRGTELDATLDVACVESNRGMTDSLIVMHETMWYICDVNDDVSALPSIPTAWRKATNAEADTALFGIPEEKKDSVKVGNINKSHYYVYDGDQWRFGTDLDKALGVCDTTKLNTLANLDGAVNDPNAWYVCVDNEYLVIEEFRLPATWRKATNYEMDTFGWKAALPGTVDSGRVNKNLTYVYEGNAWRQGTRLDRYLKQGCIQSRKDTLVQKAGLEWYTCVADTANDLSWSMEWRRIADTELDLAYWNYFKDDVGTILTAPSGKKRVWDADTLREPDDVELNFNRGCVSGIRGHAYEMQDGWLHSCDETAWDLTPKFRDTRDSKLYKVVTIGTQVWMAENLNYGTTNSSCYSDEASNCTKYGRLYTWAAMSDACPSGWHLPDTTEWNVLITAVGDTSTAGSYLKSVTGWDDSIGGKDGFFSALPAGFLHFVMGYKNEGSRAFFWSSTERDANAAYCMELYHDANGAHLNGNYHKDNGLSVRCLKNN